MKSMIHLTCDNCGTAFEREGRKVRRDLRYAFCSHNCKSIFYRKNGGKGSEQISQGVGSALAFHCNTALRPFRRGEKMAAWELAEYMGVAILRAMLLVKVLVRQDRLEIDPELSAQGPVPVYRLGEKGRDSVEREFALNHLPEIWEPMFNMCRCDNEYNHQA